MNRHLHPPALLAVCGLLAACGRPEGGAPQRPPPPVQTAPAVAMVAPVTIDAFGTTRERMSVDIVPQVSGLLVRTLIADGATVTNGQPLFLVDPADYAARVRQIRGAIEADRANLELATLTLQRNEAMLEKKLIAQQDFDLLKTKAAAAAAQLKVDEAALQQAELNLDRCTIRSPLDGVCSKRLVDDGNLVTAGMSRLTTIRSYDPIYVDFTISESYLDRVRAAPRDDGVRIEVRPRGPAGVFTGAVTFIDNAVNPQTGTIALRGEVPNADRRLWAQQFVDVRLIAGAVPDAVMVPEGAVQFGKMGPYLFVIQGGKADLRVVKTGVRHNDLLQIVSGVAAGEDVVVLGQLVLFPGAPVTDLAKAPPPAAPPAPADGTRSAKPATKPQE